MADTDDRRRARLGRPWSRIVVGGALALVLVGCSSAPPVEEVIPRGDLPQSDEWCQIVTEEEVSALLGDGEMDRLRQVGDYDPHDSPASSCDIVWADGHEPVALVDGRTILVTGGGRHYLDELTNLRGLLGPQGERLSPGSVEQLQPGVYLDVENHTLAVFLSCDLGDDLPAIMSMNLATRPTQTGRVLTAAELDSLGERVEEITRWVHQCPGDVSPLGAKDWEPLLDLATAQ